MEASDKTT